MSCYDKQFSRKGSYVKKKHYLVNIYFNHTFACFTHAATEKGYKW